MDNCQRMYPLNEPGGGFYTCGKPGAKTIWIKSEGGHLYTVRVCPDCMKKN